jgi:5-formyltetrahydrofolate cyclo-ligase
MSELRIVKNELRVELLEKRKNIPSETRELWDKKIAGVFLGSISYRFCDIVLVYVSAKEEISTVAIIEHSLASKKIVACPISNTDENTLSFKTIKSTEELNRGSFSILEPPETNRDFRELAFERLAGKKGQSLAVCVIPCLAYDSDGYRMGYGKGYYDRFLPTFEGTKIGLCYSGFKSDKLPKGKYDVKLDVIITEKGVTVI